MIDGCVLVLSRARTLLSRSIFGTSLAGDGLLVRLRSTSIGLLGVVAAVGLGLIAFISQLGWPGVFSQPIPGSPVEAGTVHDAIALTRPAPPAIGVSSASRALRQAAAHEAVRRHRSAPASSADTAIGGSRQLAAAGVETTAPTSPSAPASTPVAESTPQTSAPAAETPAQPTTTAVGNPQPTTSPTSTSGPQTAGSISKPGSDHDAESKGDSTSPGSHDTGSTPADSKQDGSSGRSGWGHGGGPSKHSEPPVPSKPAAPPAVAPPPKYAPEAPEYTDGRDEGWHGKSDWHRH
jgi:hypothetical protein